MAWNRERSERRIKDRDFDATEVTVTKLSRERNFENLGPKEALEAYGVHFYADFSGFREAVDKAGEDKEKQKKIVRGLNVLTKVAADLLASSDHSETMQVQSSRTHGFTFKPYDDEKERAVQAILKAIDFASYAPIFNDIFESEIGVPLTAQVGMDSGRTYIVNIGKRGNRELLSLGGPASIAAKNVGRGDSITISEKVYNHLPTSLKSLFSKATKGDRTVYAAFGLRWENLTEIKNEFGHSFTNDRFSKKTNDYKAEYNLDDIDISKAIEIINFDSLSSRVVKRNDSVSIYADLDGFTALMDDVETEDDAKDMVRLFTGIRNEVEDVLTVDFENGTKIQQRGDCILANYHIPAAIDFESKRTLAAVEAAVGLMSSMELLNKHYKPTKTLALQIGEASGKVFFSRIGKNGAKSPAIVGRSVDKAESLQQQSAPGEIRICPKTFDRLPEGALKDSFNESADGESYATKNMSSKRLVDLEDRKLANAAFEERARADVVRPGFFHVGVAESKEDWRHVNTPPHFSGRKNRVLGDN